ncbi:MAG: DnaB-like helicase C-terminal domain-containing protein [Flavobacteriales bacterium]|nr:DnaB-like helicase C-terminal domain-containing protein [Flavobacteriales bacterium]
MPDKNKTQGHSKPIRLLAEQAIAELLPMEDANAPRRIPTGFADLDKLTGGWRRGDLVVVAARPGMGLTSLVLSMVRSTAMERKRPVAIFSLEASGRQLASRMISMGSGISFAKLRNGALSEADNTLVREHAERISKAPIFIDDRVALVLSELCAEARRLKSDHDVDLLVIDHLQLIADDMSGRGIDRARSAGGISRRLKQLARELDVPVIVMSQVSRTVETRGGDRRPQLTVLRDAGDAEQNADVVCFLYRPEYYRVTEDEHGSTRGIGELIVSKNRNGPLGAARLRFIPETVRFKDLESDRMASAHGASRSDRSVGPGLDHIPF